MAEIGNWMVEFEEDYSQLFSEHNWYTFRFAHIEIENDVILGGYECTAVVLGIGFRVRWNHTRTEMVDEINRRVADVLADPPKSPGTSG